MSNTTALIRRRFDLRGQVQGVGFRPYVYRVATALGLHGSVANNSNGAIIDLEGPAASIGTFERELLDNLPPLARVSELTRTELEPTGQTGFRIRASEADPGSRPEITPDAATCADCRRELLDAADRRYRYPFVNCTNCGPRYSIIRAVPYDRPQTTMAVFEMCGPCAAEYADPGNRRFHAQPNACPVCGPQVRLYRISQPVGGGTGKVGLCDAPGEAVAEAARLLASGEILAVKGIGGYHLACRADDDEVVSRLRQRKLRDGKPLAVMVADPEAARRLCRLSAADEEALTSSAAPIVLAPQADGHGLAGAVAPGSADFGVMLPYAPLHHLLFAEGLGPLVMTSANLSGLPLTFRDEDALRELADVADAFLVHNREIFRPVDDSVVFTFREEAVPLRRARGYAPRPVALAGFGAGGDEPLSSVRERRILAVGAELKSTVCLLTRGEAVLSEHLGDLTRPESYRHFTKAIERLKELCGFAPDAIACDLHPRYLATEYAQRAGVELIRVQHHHAHIASVMAEWGESGPVVGLACDGTGFGTDRAVWGCEVLACVRGEFERCGHLTYFPLVGGDVAAIETWRPAAALLHAAGEKDWMEVLEAAREDGASIPADVRSVFEQQLRGGFNAPPTSSLGRVFDAASFVLGVCARNRHEAEAAMALEALAASEPEVVEPLAYDVTCEVDGIRMSLARTIVELVRGRKDGERVAALAARFHEAIARMLRDAARATAEGRGVNRVALSGGCFANRRLLKRVVALLEADGREVLYHRRVPCGDGGLSLGQAVVAAWQLRAKAQASCPGRGQY